MFSWCVAGVSLSTSKVSLRQLGIVKGFLQTMSKGVDRGKQPSIDTLQNNGFYEKSNAE